MKRTAGGKFKPPRPALKKQASQQRSAGANYQAGREHTRQPKSELKAFDLAQIATSMSTAGVFTLLNVPENGPELYQRVGRRIYMKSVHIRGTVLAAATTTQDYGRIIVFYDSQPNGAAPTLAALLADSNAGHATAVTSEINLDNRERFKILRDMPFLLPSCTNTAGVITNLGMQDTVKQSMQFDEFIKLKGLETVYNGTNGGTIADITSGSLFVVTFSGIGNYNTSWSSRLRYYD